MTPEQIRDAIPRLSALVVGDICLDRWCYYDPALSEPSRETGIPRLAVVETVVTPGAGGTIANNLVSLGVKRLATLGVYGEDGHGSELLRALSARGVDARLMVNSGGVATFTYTKLINRSTGREDVPRVDFVNTSPLPAEAEQSVLAHLREAAGDFDVVFVSDQAETDSGGVITPRVRELLSGLARGNPRQTFLADSRKRIHLFRDLPVKPNRDEAAEACRGLFGEIDYARLRSQIRAPLMFVTLGPDGALVVDEHGECRVEGARVEEPADICGAGDSFAAGAALALAAGASPAEAAAFGNRIASIAITTSLATRFR